MALMDYLSRVRRLIREYGWRVGSALALHRIFGHLGSGSGLYWYKIYRQPLLDASASRENASIKFRWLDAYEDLLAALPRPVVNLKARFEQNVRCLVAIREDELLACAWFGFDQFEEDEVRCTFLLPPTAVWDFDIFVFPRYRIGRLFVRLWREANKVLVAEGFTDTLSRISVYNNNSIRSHEKLGAERVGSTLFLKLGRFQLSCSSLRPYFSLSFSTRQSPRISLRELHQS